jgi:hypothetical protein
MSPGQQQQLPGSLYAAFAVVLAALVAGALLSSSSDRTPPGAPVSPERARSFPPAVADPVPYDGRSPSQPGSPEERVLVELPRPALGERPDLATMDAAARRTYVDSLEQEVAALTSALRARGVRLRELVTFERAWHGFAATVRERDLPRLDSLGVRKRPVRRFYPALSEPVPSGRDRPVPAVPAEAPEVAVLAGGLAGRSGYDAVDRDADPSPGADPRDPARTERSGELLAGLLAGHGAAVRPVRISALRSAPGLPGSEEFARTDELLDGLEHAVDPNGDGDPADHVPVALIGVNAPYAGFHDAPEAQAVDGARRLGTLVIAPAGEEGRAAGPYGTLGSPAAAAAAVSVAALSGPAGPPGAELVVGGAPLPAVLLAGTPPAGELRTAGPVEAVDPAVLLAEGAPRLDGAMVVVRAGANPPAQVAAAAAAGAAAVVVADPRPGRTLAAVPLGRVAVPVVGLTGPAAAAALDIAPGTAAGLRRSPLADRAGAPCGQRISPFSSHGPAFSGAPKPELARFGCATLGGMLVAGSAVAAAQAAGDAARAKGGAGERRRALLAGADRPSGSLSRSARVPIGRLRVSRTAGLTVRLVIGAFDRGEPTAGIGTRIVPAARLDLTLEAGGQTVRRLTPADGERGVLPGEYAYTLPRSVLADLPAGRYAFRAAARAPRQRRATVAVSRRFALP